MQNHDSIVAKGLQVSKDHHLILRGIDFSVARGSLTGLIGPSGSGKTTLIRSIVGVQQISGGSLSVLGRPAGGKGLGRRIGYMAQSAAVYEDLTVHQNMKYFATLVGADKGQVERVIAQIHLEDQRGALVKRLSGGQRARVSLGISLLGDPDLLVLDEPTVGLDPILRQELWRLFGELAASGKTLVVSSHVMDEAERCRDLLLLREGTLLWHGTKRDLLEKTNQPSVEGAFIAMINSREDA